MLKAVEPSWVLRECEQSPVDKGTWWGGRQAMQRSWGRAMHGAPVRTLTFVLRKVGAAEGSEQKRE